MTLQRQPHFDYSAIVERPKFAWPEHLQGEIAKIREQAR